MKPTLRRRSSRGSNLMMFCAVALLIIGFLGITIYTGMQAFLESDLQRASMNAALVGASAYYKSPGGTATIPAPDIAGATATATSVFNGIVTNSSLKGFKPTLVSVTNNDNNDSITVTTQATLVSGFLAPIGIKDIQINATATARALKYEPTAFTGPIQILPDGVLPETYSQVLNLAFPLTDGPGNDLYLEQDSAHQQGYVVEACNDTDCYDITSGATPVGTSQVTTVNGVQVIYGTAMVDLEKAGVRKATKLRITHANEFTIYNKGVAGTPAAPDPLTIKRIMVFGYAGTCAAPDSCGVPAGFSPVY